MPYSSTEYVTESSLTCTPLLYRLAYPDLPACSSELALQLEGCLQIEVMSHFSPDYDILNTLHMNLRKCQTGMVRDGY